MRRWKLAIVAAFIAASTVGSAYALSVNVTFTKLTGVTGGSPAATAVYRADLSGLGLSQVQSISIVDNSGGVGGSPGQFSGFDLDAIILSNSMVGDAGSAAALVGLAGFDYSPSGTYFTAGTQRPIVDPALFGSLGGNVNNAVATLGSFDGNSTTAIPGAHGFISMGDGGILGFDLTSVIATAGLYLYIGEVGDNGEVAAGRISVSDQPIVPLPAAVWAGMVVLSGVGGVRTMRRRRAV